MTITENWSVLLDNLNNARKTAQVELYEMKNKSAKVVGTFCQYAPLEIINAAGLHCVGLCGKTYEPIHLAETELPANLCPLIKSSYGHVMGDTCPFAYFSDLVVGETTCDGKKKMFEMMAKHKDMHVIHLPNMPERKSSYASWVSELRTFKEVLEKKFEIDISNDMLKEEIRHSNEVRKLKTKIFELGKQDPLQ